MFENEYNALYNSVCYEYNEVSNLHNDIRYDIDKYCIEPEDDEIFTHTHDISIDDVRVATLKRCKLYCIVMCMHV